MMVDLANIFKGVFFLHLTVLTIGPTNKLKSKFDKGNLKEDDNGNTRSSHDLKGPHA